MLFRSVHAYGRREVVVRVNGLDTPWIASDIAAVAASHPDAILIPKVSRVDDIRRARAALSAAQAPVPRRQGSPPLVGFGARGLDDRAPTLDFGLVH